MQRRPRLDHASAAAELEPIERIKSLNEEALARRTAGLHSEFDALRPRSQVHQESNCKGSEEDLSRSRGPFKGRPWGAARVLRSRRNAAAPNRSRSAGTARNPIKAVERGCFAVHAQLRHVRAELPRAPHLFS
jgi:hypothetical protein